MEAENNGKIKDIIIIVEIIKLFAKHVSSREWLIRLKNYHETIVFEQNLENL